MADWEASRSCKVFDNCVQCLHRVPHPPKAEIDSYPSFGPFFGPHNPSPLRCAGCSDAPATVLVALGRTNADRTPAPGHVLLLHCRDCAGKCKGIAEGAGRAVALFAIGVEEGI